jgi:hypothetical protein
MKKCSTCKAYKNEADFNKNRAQKGGFNAECRECQNIRGLIYSATHKEQTRKRGHNWYLAHKEYCSRIKPANWRANNLEEARARDREKKARWLQKPENRLANCIKSVLSHSLSKGSKAYRKWGSLVGYDAAQLKRHLEKQFLLGMSWENYGQWHIDHIIPIVAFNYNTPDDLDFKRCWALNNLRPLWKFENLSKQAKLERPFQPGLLLAVNE